MKNSIARIRNASCNDQRYTTRREHGSLSSRESRPVPGGRSNEARVEPRNGNGRRHDARRGLRVGVTYAIATFANISYPSFIGGGPKRVPGGDFTTQLISHPLRTWCLANISHYVN